MTTLNEAVLLPLRWPSEGTVDKPVALRLVDSFGGWARGGDSGAELGAEETENLFPVVLSSEPRGDQRGHKEHAVTLVSLLYPCL